MDTHELEKLLAAVTPATNNLKVIAAEEWSIDGPDDFSWLSVGREDDRPRIFVIERGFGTSADNRLNAISQLCIMLPDLARRVIAAEKLASVMKRVSSDDHWRTTDNTLWPDMCAALAEWEAAQ